MKKYQCFQQNRRALAAAYLLPHPTPPYLKPVEGDGCDADGGDEDVGTLEHGDQLAHEATQLPLGAEEQVEVEGLREDAQRQIRDGQVDDEDVARSAHVRVACHHVAHEAVAQGAEGNEQGVGQDEKGLRHRVEVEGFLALYLLQHGINPGVGVPIHVRAVRQLVTGQEVAEVADVFLLLVVVMVGMVVIAVT